MFLIGVLIIGCVIVLGVSIYRQEKENGVNPVRAEWKDTFGGPVDWDQH
jgi:hypothetical protein